MAGHLLGGIAVAALDLATLGGAAVATVSVSRSGNGNGGKSEDDSLEHFEGWLGWF